MEQVYWYCLAYAAQRHGVLVHAACLMSTHAHEVITDVHGVYPKFLETFHRTLALCTKAFRGWPEEVFNKDSTSAHALLTPEAILESIAYLIANPVEAGAVRYAMDWPGAKTLPADIGTRVVDVKRPPHYFDPGNSKWPSELELVLEMPVSLELEYGLEPARDRIAARVRRREHQAWNEARRTGRSFVGPRRWDGYAPSRLSIDVRLPSGSTEAETRAFRPALGGCACVMVHAAGQRRRAERLPKLRTAAVRSGGAELRVRFAPRFAECAQGASR